MTVHSSIPFNIALLQLDESVTQRLRAVSSLDTFEGATKNFHPDGLYSTQTFGVVGSDARFTRYAYIDLKVEILHPVVFKALIQLKLLYKEIMAGREFAVWDAERMDFVKSDIVDGFTGYEFFITHWKKIEFEHRPSIKREQAVTLIEKYKDKAMMRRIAVLPAALRDLEIDENGRASSDDINSLYYKLVAISNTINAGTVKISPEAYNSQRLSLQNTFIEIYDYLSQIVEGKKNLMMGKWASRKVFNGTRNVITSMDTKVSHLEGPGNIGFNDTAIGLYQTLKGMLPISIFHLKTGFLTNVFTASGAPALLVNKDTLMSERVQPKSDVYDQWMTNEGLEKFITYFQENSIRHNPVKVGEHYLALLYRGPDNTFKLIHGLDELPPDRRAEDCRPVTMAEFLYITIYAVANTYPVLVTRYPVTGIGSIYASKVFLKSTIKSEVRKELGNDWRPIEGKVAYEFPTDSSFFNSLSPHSSRLKKLGGDFDGDTASASIAYTDEAIAEIERFLKSKACYVNTDGEFVNDINVDTISFVLKNLTGE